MRHRKSYKFLCSYILSVTFEIKCPLICAQKSEKKKKSYKISFLKMIILVNSWLQVYNSLHDGNAIILFVALQIIGGSSFGWTSCTVTVLISAWPLGL